MRILIVNAAPRMEAGNTQVMLNPFLVGLRHEKAEVDVCLLARKKIESCKGCFTCYAQTPGVCVHSDDMPALIERVRLANMMVLATPVYIDGMTSLAKRFMDRLVVFVDPHFTQDEEGLVHPLRWKFPEKLALVSVCGYPGLRNFDPLMLHMQRIARNFHTQFVGAVLRPAVFSVRMAQTYPDRVRSVLEGARRAGEELVRTGQMSRETLNTVAADICPIEELMARANAYWDKELSKGGDQLA